LSEDSGSSEDLYHDAKHPYTRALMSAIPVPDVRRKSTRIVLGGDAPSPMNPPSGCPFHPRCPEAMAQCKDVVPKKINTGTVDKPHFVRFVNSTAEALQDCVVPSCADRPIEICDHVAACRVTNL